MRYTFDHDLHIHSTLSTCCADAEQTPERILRYARENGLSTICLTNHFWDETLSCDSAWYKAQNFSHICRALPLPQGEDCRFLFGCETELDYRLTLGISKQRYDDFDFIVIPLTHFHKVGFTLSEAEAQSVESKASAWLRRITAVLEMDLPFYKVGLAHLACPLIARAKREEYLAVLDCLPQTELENIFSQAARVGLGIEINTRDFSYAPEEEACVLRMFLTAKACGCKFYLASDAHSVAYFELAKRSFARAITALSLTEEDKFRLS